MIESIRVRLTLWYVLISALLQAVLCLCIYGYIYAHLYRQVNGILGNVRGSVRQAIQAAPSQQGLPTRLNAALASVKHTETPITIYAADGKILAERPSGAAYLNPMTLPPVTGTIEGVNPGDSARHIGARRFAIEKMQDPQGDDFFYVAVSTSLYSRMDELHTARVAFLIGVPVMLLLTACGAWLLTGRSLAPAVGMAERARTIGANNRAERLSAPHANDELGRLANALNELLDRLADARDADRQFMADAAHELRTPLSVMQTAATVTLMSTDTTSDEYRSTLATIEGYVERLTRSVNDVFRLARADAGYKTLQAESLYLDEIVTEAARAASWLARPKDIRVHFAQADASPYRGDAVLLHEMLLNLLENSTKYTPAGGAIELRLEGSPDFYRITVTDTGIGIQPTDRDRIFDRFYRGRPAGNDCKAMQGTGLGLAIARWIAELHSGTLELQASTAMGSTFLVTLPMRCSPAEKADS